MHRTTLRAAHPFCRRALPRKAKLTNISLQLLEHKGRASALHLARALPGRCTHMLPIWYAGPRMTLGAQQQSAIFHHLVPLC